MSFSFSSIGSAIGSFLSGAGTTLSSTQTSGLVQAVLNVINPNAANEKTELAQMAAFVNTNPQLIPDMAKKFAEGADPALAGAVSPLFTLPLPPNALEIIMTTEQMLQQGM